jgi:hypothetical protein
LARFKHALAAAALISALALAAFGAAACDDDNSAQSENGASQQTVDQLTTTVQRNQMMTSIITLDSLGLHGIDETLAEGTVESSFAPAARTAVRLLALTDWDSSVASDAETVHGHAVDLLVALEAEDVEAASAAATELHDGEHDLSHDVWAILAADLPPDAGGVEEEHGDETPAAGETETGDHDEAAETPAAEETP